MTHVGASPERDRLLNLVVDLILREGVIDLSLSAVARKISSNNRMLLYYFGSKEALLDEASVRAFERFPRLRDLFDRLAEPGDIEDRLFRAWDDLSADDNLPYLRLYFQRFGIAMREVDGWGGLLERAGYYWSDRIHAQLRSDGFDDAISRTVARAVVALWRGMQIMLLSGAPREELTQAYRFSVGGLVAQLRSGTPAAV